MSVRPAPQPRDRPILLPFTGRPPGPIFEYGRIFILYGHPVQVVGERWRAEDAHLAPIPTEPDSQRPGIALCCYIRDVETGEIILPVSGEELSAAVALARQAQGDSFARATDHSAG